MGSILIRHATLIATFDDASRIEHNADMYIEGPEIKAIGSALKVKADETIDASHMIVLPGLINTHHHLFQTLTRNLPRAQNATLFEWLTTLYPIWQELTPEAVYWSALAGMAELLLTGCTTTTDHLYIFPRGTSEGLLDETIRAAHDIGIRFYPTRGSMCRGKSQGGLPPDDIVQQPAEILRDSERVIQAYHDPGRFSMCQIALSPCSPFSVDEGFLREIAQFGRQNGVRLHTHIAETRDEETYCQQIYRKRPLAFLESVGWLGSDVWLAHAIHLDDAELSKLSQTQTGVAHCPVSNMRLASGIARVPRMLELGVPVGLAVDGSASNDTSDMLGEVRQCLLLHRVSAGIGAMSAEQALRLATRGGAQLFGRTDIGSLEVGKAADCILINLNQIGFAGALHDPLAAVVFCGSSHVVHTVIVNGQIVVRDSRLTRADERNIVEKVNRLGGDMVSRATKRR
jgi:8-oxoguanine deaminase